MFGALASRRPCSGPRPPLCCGGAISRVVHGPLDRWENGAKARWYTTLAPSVCRRAGARGTQIIAITAPRVSEQRTIERVLGAVLPDGMVLAHLRTTKAGSLRFIVFDLLVPGATTVEVAHALCDRLEAAISAELSPCDVTIHVEPLPW